MEHRYVEYLGLQLVEVDMLSSMYPSSNEFQITDPSILADISDYIEGKRETLPPQLDYRLTLAFTDMQATAELNVTLPHRYPSVIPEVFIRSQRLSRENQHLLNSAIIEFLRQNSKGDLCICSLISWLSENFSKYFSLSQTDDTRNLSAIEKKNGSFSRLWIYSHHIYNKDKRRSILQSAGDLSLSGFCLPGKPGVICVEGFTDDCHDFLQGIKKMNWKKIGLKKEETYSLDNSNCDSMRRFDDFKEISFQVRQGPAREYHMNMGEFFKYLEEHECGYIFQEIFGMEGKASVQA